MSMTDIPAVSVICVFLNGERFLADALDSVLAQSFTDYELILVNDGSYDASSAIAARYVAALGDRARLLVHPKCANLGISASRQLGLSCARGRYVAFLDADDIWPRHKLRQQVALLDRTPQAGMACGLVTYWGSWNGGKDVIVRTGEGLRNVEPPGLPVLELYPQGRKGAPSPSEVLLRRDALEAVGGPEPTFRDMYEDQVMFTKVMLSYATCFSDNHWLHYRIGYDNCTEQVRRANLYLPRRKKYFLWLREYLDKHPELGSAGLRRLVNLELIMLGFPVAWKIRWRLRRFGDRCGQFAERLLSAVSGAASKP